MFRQLKDPIDILSELSEKLFMNSEMYSDNVYLQMMNVLMKIHNVVDAGFMNKRLHTAITDKAVEYGISIYVDHVDISL